FSACHRIGIRQQPIGKNRREMLGRRRDRQSVAQILSLQYLRSRQRALRPAVDQALVLQVLVEQRVYATVGRFLTDEAANLGFPIGALIRRERGESFAYRIDEELLAKRKTHRQRVEEGGLECIAAAPMP